MTAARLEQLERDMNNQTVRKSKSGRWKTTKGRRSTIIRNWFMEGAGGGGGGSSNNPSPAHQFYQSYGDRPQQGPSPQHYSNQYFYQAPPVPVVQQQQPPRRPPVSSSYAYYANDYRQQVFDAWDKKKQDTPPQPSQLGTGRPGLPFNWQSTAKSTPQQVPQAPARPATPPKDTRVTGAGLVQKATLGMVPGGTCGTDELRETEKLFDFLEEYDASPALPRRPPPAIPAEFQDYDDFESTTTRL